MRACSWLLAATLSIVAACGAFGEDGPTGSSESPDAGADAEADAGDAATTADGPASHAPTRCGEISCPAGTKCCLPLDRGEPSAAPRCVERSAVCGADYGELLCSSPDSCKTGEVCCVTAERNGGQTAFDIKRSFCVSAAACPDQDLQHSMCELGVAEHCPGKACKPYLTDVNDAQQSLGVNPSGYATCQ